MCGFVRRVTDNPAVQELLENVGIDLSLKPGQFYPRSTVSDLIIQENNSHRTVDPIWWYQLEKKRGSYRWDARYNSFNARNLRGPLWREPLKKRRGIFVADAIGESNTVDGKKSQYLMEATDVLLLGALYKRWETPADPVYSMAIITRSPIEGWDKYHEKSMPLFLPPDAEILKLWLDPSVEQDSLIDDLLVFPRLYSDLEITPVKTYKRAERISEPKTLIRTV